MRCLKANKKKNEIAKWEANAESSDECVNGNVSTENNCLHEQPMNKWYDSIGYL